MKVAVLRTVGVAATVAAAIAISSDGAAVRHHVELVRGDAREQLEADHVHPDPAVATDVIGAERAAAARIARTKPATRQQWASIGPSTVDVSTLGTTAYGPPTQWSGRANAIAVEPPCGRAGCRLYLGTAGGGVWTTPDALARTPTWQQISDGQIPTNFIGSLLVDPTDPTGKTIYAGTGHAQGAGLGLYRSRDGGRSWKLVPGSFAVANERAIATIAVDPHDAQHILIGTDVGRHGDSADQGGWATPPNAPPIGLYQSFDGGKTFTPALVEAQDAVDPAAPDGGDYFRGGVRAIAFDPTHAGVLYASMFAYGLYRSSDGGKTFARIFVDATPADVYVRRYEFAVAALPDGRTRIYLAEGARESSDAEGRPTDGARLYRVDDATAPSIANSDWTELSSTTDGTPGYGVLDICGFQCNLDFVVSSPAGRPDTVAVGGEMQYAELVQSGDSRSNGRAVVLSTDAGVHWADMTGDAGGHAGGTSNDVQELHPDIHAIAFAPNDPSILFVGSDGGVTRTNGTFTDASSQCVERGLKDVDLADCQAWLSRVPTTLATMNAGLGTLQLQNIAVDPRHPLTHLLAGTQDNGTLVYTGRPTWHLGVSGDGGAAGFDAARSNEEFHTYFFGDLDVNFHGSAPASWDFVGDPFEAADENRAFYTPMLADPVTSGQIFAGLESVWRTQDWGGDRAFLDAHCNTSGAFGTSDAIGSGRCGDWVPVGPNLANNAGFGDKDGSFVSVLARGRDKSTMWVATQLGRVFVTRNAGAPADSVTFTRIDTDAQPTRFPSSICVDPANPLHAFVTYSGYNAYAAAAGTTLGHVFEVKYVPGAGATWTSLDHNLGDQPALGCAYDAPSGALFIATDFAVDRLDRGASRWVPAGGGLPPIAVYALALGDAADGTRVLYAATHGRGAYRLQLAPRR